MSGKEQLEERVNYLEDSRFETLCTQVSEIHRIINGNGKIGLKAEVQCLKTRTKILSAVMFILLSALIGGKIMGNEIKVDEEIKPIIEQSIGLLSEQL